MATTMRGGSVGKEKRMTSPSSSTIKRSPKPSSSSPSTTKNSSISERKSISNHSRPVLNSKNDPSKTPKKSVLDKPASSQVQPTVVDRRPSSDRPSPSSQVQPAAVDRRRPLDRPSPSSQVQSALDRRRSFDRPPPSLQVQKVVQNGPTTRNVKSLRSSSFSSRTSSTAPLASSGSRRPATSTSVSSRKVSVKGVPPVSKPGALRRSASANSTMTDSTKGCRASTKKGLERIPQEGASVDYETRSDSHIMNEDHVLVNIDSELESLPEISDMSETANDLGDPTNIELEAHQPVEQDHRDIDTEDERQQEDNKLVVDDQEDPTSVKHPDEDIQGMAEETPTPDNQKQIDSEKQDSARANNEAEHEESNAEPAKTLMEDKAIEEAEVINREEETKTSSTIVRPSLRSHPSPKKENQAYNDVIEETATKLRMKKNKVLALAGAFETVISLQDTNKKH